MTGSRHIAHPAILRRQAVHASVRATPCASRRTQTSSWLRNNEGAIATRRVTAISAAKGFIALKATRAILKAGIGVPVDRSPVGFDVELSSIKRPPISTIRQPTYDRVQAAVEILLKRTKRKKRLPDIVFLVELVERQSCQALR